MELALHEPDRPVEPVGEETLEQMWPDAVAGDNAYGTIAIRDRLTSHEIAAVAYGLVLVKMYSFELKK